MTNKITIKGCRSCQPNEGLTDEDKFDIGIVIALILSIIIIVLIAYIKKKNTL